MGIFRSGCVKKSLLLEAPEPFGQRLLELLADDASIVRTPRLGQRLGGTAHTPGFQYEIETYVKLSDTSGEEAQVLMAAIDLLEQDSFLYPRTALAIYTISGVGYLSNDPGWKPGARTWKNLHHVKASISPVSGFESVDMPEPDLVYGLQYPEFWLTDPKTGERELIAMYHSGAFWSYVYEMWFREKRNQVTSINREKLLESITR